MNSIKNSCSIKLIFLGKKCSGKSSLLSSLQNNTFNENHLSTVGVDYAVVRDSVIINNKKFLITFNIFDMGGDERFMNIIKSYFADTFIACFIYDLTNEESFTNINELLELFIINNNNCKNIFIIGTKLDKNLEEQCINLPKINDLLLKLNNNYPSFDFKHFRVSSKERININNIKNSINEKILELYNSILMQTVTELPHGIKFIDYEINNILNSNSHNTTKIRKEEGNFFRKLFCCLF